MMEFSFKTEVNATPEKIWDYYCDVQKWNVWEDDLEDVTLNGSFATGTTGVMKLANMPPMEFLLTEVTPNEGFCDKTPTPLGDVLFDHKIIKEADEIYIQHIVKLETKEGNAEKLGFIRQIFADVPDSIMALKRVVEK